MKDCWKNSEEEEDMIGRGREVEERRMRSGGRVDTVCENTHGTHT